MKRALAVFFLLAVFNNLWACSGGKGKGGDSGAASGAASGGDSGAASAPQLDPESQRYADCLVSHCPDKQSVCVAKCADPRLARSVFHPDEPPPVVADPKFSYHEGAAKQ